MLTVHSPDVFPSRVALPLNVQRNPVFVTAELSGVGKSQHRQVVYWQRDIALHRDVVVAGVIVLVLLQIVVVQKRRAIRALVLPMASGKAPIAGRRPLRSGFAGIEVVFVRVLIGGE